MSALPAFDIRRCPESSGPLTESASGATYPGADADALARIGRIPYRLDPAQRDADNAARERAWDAMSESERAIATMRADQMMQTARGGGLA